MKVNGYEHITSIIENCDGLLSVLEEIGKDPNEKKEFGKRFSATETATMIGRTRTSLHRAEKEGIAVPQKDPKTNRSMGYTLSDVNKLRDYFGTRPKRKEQDPCLKIAIQSFKGGVAKSVTAVHFAQYMALRGYRVLLADFDPQASATSAFGFLPDKSFTEDDTLIPFLRGEQNDLQYCVLETYFPGVSIIPSCLAFYDAEFKLAFSAANSESASERKGYFTEFGDAFKSIEQYFDVIIFDSPPALGMITINILTSADALVVPTPPALYDFSSTVQYFKMIQNVLGDIVPEKEYNFIKILVTKADLRKTKHKDFIQYMGKVFGPSLMKFAFSETQEIQNNAANFKTVYDVEKADDKKSHIRALNILDSVCREIELEVLQWWPSYEEQLVEEGVL